MDEIPDDALVSARRAYDLIENFGWNVSWYSKNPIPDDAWPVDIIARAIMAERERCAALFDPAVVKEISPVSIWRGDAIAAAIRNGPTP